MKDEEHRAPLVASSLCLIAFVLFLVGCDRAAISGTVTDVQGVPLPGVAVIAEGAEAQTLTDALGRYTLSSPVGIAGIRLVKDGYTSGFLALEPMSNRAITARGVGLWPLPRGAGAYLVEDYRFRAMTAGEPKPFATETGPAYGIRLTTPVEKTAQMKPLMMCHKVPAYDIRLARLRPVKATGPEGGFDVWTVETSIPVEVAPIDEPERYLVEVRIADPLTPGTYAMHWGALEGRKSTEPRAFLFAVEEANQPAEAAAPTPETKPASKKPVAQKASAAPLENVDTTAADAEAEAPPH